MIVLDTSVVSELTRASPAPRVAGLAGRQDIRRLFVTVVTESEIRTGIASLLTGRPRDGLAQAAAFIAALGVRVQAGMTDRAWGYTRVAASARSWRSSAAAISSRAPIGPDERQGLAFHQEPARGVGLRPPLSPATRPASTPCRPGSPPTISSCPTPRWLAHRRCGSLLTGSWEPHLAVATAKDGQPSGRASNDSLVSALPVGRAPGSVQPPAQIGS